MALVSLLPAGETLETRKYYKMSAFEPEESKKKWKMAKFRPPMTFIKEGLIVSL